VTNGTSQAIRQSLDLMIRINQQGGSANLAELRLVLEPEIDGLAATGCMILADTLKRISTSTWRWRKQPGTRLILSLLDSFVGLLREQRSRIFDVEGGPERG
jgi:hypothetical protein